MFNNHYKLLSKKKKQRSMKIYSINSLTRNHIDQSRNDDKIFTKKRLLKMSFSHLKSDIGLFLSFFLFEHKRQYGLYIEQRSSDDFYQKKSMEIIRRLVRTRFVRRDLRNREWIECLEEKNITTRLVALANRI